MAGSTPSELPLETTIPDVVFDHGVVLAYADTCERAAVRLDEVRRARFAAARRATEQWRGMKRVLFDRDLAWMGEASDRLAAALRGVAGAARAVSDEMAAEQARREQAREELARRRAAQAELAAQQARQSQRPQAQGPQAQRPQGEDPQDQSARSQPAAPSTRPRAA